MYTKLLKRLPFEVTEQQAEQLQQYVDLLLKWNKAFNLIGKSTESEIWERHILDSAQLVPLLEDAKTVLDFGCGAGLPSVVLAILGDAHITACEKVSKKTDFIAEVRRRIGLEDTLTVAAHNVEKFTENNVTFDLITARAVAPLDVLVEWTQAALDKNGKFVFPKGEDFQKELNVLHTKFNMTETLISSITSATGSIVILEPKS